MKDFSLNLDVSIDYTSNNGLLEVNEELYEEVYRIANYFKEELNYDSIPFDQFGLQHIKYQAFLFEEKAMDLELIDGDFHHRIYGACLFSEYILAEEDNMWKLEWIWIHPYFRNRGKLSKYWNEFEAKFGDFLIGSPISNDMAKFLEIKSVKSNFEHIEV